MSAYSTVEAASIIIFNFGLLPLPEETGTLRLIQIEQLLLGVSIFMSDT